MNLSQTIELYCSADFMGPGAIAVPAYAKKKRKNMKAGGPGSGCKGDNCGRPSTGEDDSLVFYHTTRPDNISSIREHGLKPRRKNGLVYMTSGLPSELGNDKSQTIRIEIPRSEVKRNVHWSRGHGVGGYVWKGELPKKYLKEDLPSTWENALSWAEKHGHRSLGERPNMEWLRKVVKSPKHK